MIWRGISSASHFRRVPTAITQCVRQSSTKLAPRPGHKHTVSLKSWKAETFYKNRIHSFLSGCVVYNKPLLFDSELVEKIYQKYRTGDVAVYSRGVKGLVLTNIVTSNIKKTKLLKETGLMKKFTFGDLVLKIRGEQRDMLLNSNDQFEFLGTIHKAKDSPSVGIALPVMSDTQAVVDGSIFLSQTKAELEQTEYEDSTEYRHVYRMKLVGTEADYPVYTAIPIECVGVIVKSSNFHKSMPMEHDQYLNRSRVFSKGFNIDKEDRDRLLRNTNAFINLRKYLNYGFDHKQFIMLGLTSETDGFLYESKLLDKIDDFLWSQFIRINVTQSDKYTFDFDIEHVHPKRSRVRLASFSGRHSSTVPDILNAIRSFGLTVPSSFYSIYHGSQTIPGQHSAKIRRMSYFLQIQAQEESKFKTGVLANKEGEGSQIRLDLWKVLNQHETRMDQLALVYDDCRADYTMCMDDSKDSVLREDAVSVTKLPSGIYDLRIHSLDVQYFIRKGTLLYDRMLTRWAMNRSLKETLGMQLGKYTPVITLKQKVSQSGQLLGMPEVTRSIIGPKFCGSFKEIRVILNDAQQKNDIFMEKERLNEHRFDSAPDYTELTALQRLALDSRRTNVDELWDNYTLLNEVVDKITKNLSKDDDWVGINKNGIRVDHFNFPPYLNLRKAYGRRQYNRAELYSPDMLISQVMTIANLLMHRYLLTEVDHKQMDFFQSLRVIGPYQTLYDHNGNVKLNQNFSTRWTSGTMPNDFFTHIVLKQIIGASIKQRVLHEVKRKQKDTSSRSFYMRKQIRHIMPRKEQQKTAHLPEGELPEMLAQTMYTKLNDNRKA